MSKELKGETKPQSNDRRRQPKHKELNQAAQAADIAFVGADGFILNTKRKDVVIGATSLYEVNKLIEEQNDTLQETKEHEQLLDECLPTFRLIAMFFQKSRQTSSLLIVKELITTYNSRVRTPCPRGPSIACRSNT